MSMANRLDVASMRRNLLFRQCVVLEPLGVEFDAESRTGGDNEPTLLNQRFRGAYKVPPPGNLVPVVG